MAQSEITWEGPEFEYKQKDAYWYWSSIAVATVCVGFAAWQKNFLFGFFILVAEILILAWGNQKPATFKFQLTQDGLFIGEKFYPYGDIEAFSSNERGERELENIIIRFNKHFRRPLRIAVPKNHSDNVKSFLEEHIQKINHEPSLIDSIEEFIGF